MGYLNPALYYRLRAMAGQSPKIEHPGEACVVHVAWDETKGAYRARFTQKGEYYVIDCPYCGDRKKRLCVGYMYGQVDDVGRRMSYVAHCFNEDCLADKRNAIDFWDRVNAFGPSEKFEIEAGEVVDYSNYMAELPGECPRLTELPRNHKAVVYLESRHWDIARIVKLYDVRFCERADERWPAARNRIIMPVYDGGVLRGWQGRIPEELPWKDPAKKKFLPPKYYTLPGMPKSYLLYGFDQAKRFRTGVLVEGPLDKWAVGGPGMAMFGPSPSHLQADRIATAFGDGSLVFMVDPEEYVREKTRERLEEKIAALRAKLPTAVIRLPEGMDPGGTERGFLYELIDQQAAEQGVPLYWEPRPETARSRSRISSGGRLAHA